MYAMLTISWIVRDAAACPLLYKRKMTKNQVSVFILIKYTLTHSLTRSPAHSLTHSLTRLFARTHFRPGTAVVRALHVYLLKVMAGGARVDQIPIDR